MMKVISMLSLAEVSALLRCRYAGRYDGQGASGKHATVDEAPQEQIATRIAVSRPVYDHLILRGLLQRTGSLLRLTERGHGALAAVGLEE